jgi:hypothetical protein
MPEECRVDGNIWVFSFHLAVSSAVFVLTCFVMCGCGGDCNVWVCVCVGFVMCGCVYVWVL